MADRCPDCGGGILVDAEDYGLQLCERCYLSYLHSCGCVACSAVLALEQRCDDGALYFPRLFREDPPQAMRRGALWARGESGVFVRTETLQDLAKKGCMRLRDTLPPASSADFD